MFCAERLTFQHDDHLLHGSLFQQSRKTPPYHLPGSARILYLYLSPTEPLEFGPKHLRPVCKQENVDKVLNEANKYSLALLPSVKNARLRCGEHSRNAKEILRGCTSASSLSTHATDLPAARRWM
ncbi:hypothetical protein AB1N83_010116 [Pleurotus pulmonarius]